MNRKELLLSGIMCLAGILLTGCQSTESESSKTATVEKVVAKQAVKAAVRHSPIAIIKAVK